MGLLLSEDGDLVTNEREKADVLDAYFSSVFTGMASPQAYHIPEPPCRLSGNEAAPPVEEERTKELLLSFGRTQVHGITSDASKGIQGADWTAPAQPLEGRWSKYSQKPFLNS